MLAAAIAIHSLLYCDEPKLACSGTPLQCIPDPRTANCHDQPIGDVYTHLPSGQSRDKMSVLANAWSRRVFYSGCLQVFTWSMLISGWLEIAVNSFLI